MSTPSEKPLPETMTAEEACETFGIRFTQWRARQWAFLKGYKKPDGTRMPGKTMPSPISGSPYSRTAVYRTEDLGALMEMSWREPPAAEPKPH